MRIQNRWKKTIVFTLIFFIIVVYGIYKNMKSNDLVFPPEASDLNETELFKLIDAALPLEGQKSPDWTNMLNAPILWITPGYSDTPYGGTRVGYARAEIDGKHSTVLRQKKEELAWTVTLNAYGPPKFGPTEIEFSPGVKEQDCFGELTDGCDFSVEEMFKRDKVKPKLLCESHTGTEIDARYLYKTSGHKSVILKYMQSGGSGGINSDIAIVLYPDQARECKSLENFGAPK